MDIFLQQVINGLVLGSVYALVALGYTMVYGILGLINFAHGEVVMVGALTSLSVIASAHGQQPGLARAADRAARAGRGHVGVHAAGLHHRARGLPAAAPGAAAGTARSPRSACRSCCRRWR